MNESTESLKEALSDDSNEYLKREADEILRKEKFIFDMFDSLIGSTFDEVLFLNLVNNNLTLLKYNSQNVITAELTEPGIRLRFIETIHPDYRAKFNETFCSDNLLAAFQSGKKSVYIDIMKATAEGKYYWARVEGVQAGKNEQGDPLVLVILTNRDKVKKLEQKNHVMTAGIMEIFGETLVLDLKSGKYIIYKADISTEQALGAGDMPRNYTEDLYTYGKMLVHPDDRELFLNAYNLDTLTERVNEGQFRFYSEVRRKAGDGTYRWCEMIGVAVENQLKETYNVLLTFRDIQDLKNAEEDRKKSERRFMAAVNAFFDAIFEYDMYTHNFVIWKKPNGFISQVLDKLEGNHEDFRILNVVRSDYTEQIKSQLEGKTIIQNMLDGKNNIVLEIPLTVDNKYYKWYSMQIQYLEKDDEHFNVMIYFKDIDNEKKEEKRKQEALKDALALAEQSNSAKSDFLSRMSHDIRTPMNAIIGMSTIAAVNLKKPEKIADCLNKIGVSAKFLLSLINDVLDMSKIESGKLNIANERFDIQELIEDITKVYYNQVKEKKQDFSVLIKDMPHRYFVGDALRINQIIINLLGNAIKYTSEYGRIKMTISTKAISREKVYLEIHVIDNGIGMSEPFLAHIFEPFRQERSDGGRVLEGSGLGLSITRNLVHLMNGRITVESSLEKGSEFVVGIPLEYSKDDCEYQDEIPDNMSVLIIDDEMEVCEYTSEILYNLGIMAEWVTEGIKGVELIQEMSENNNMFDAVIVDWKMPEMDGVETIRRLRKIAGTEIMIVIMSAFDYSEIEDEARSAGADFFITKPFFEDNIRKVLNNLRKPEKSDEEVQQSKHVFDGQRILLVEDSEINMEIAETLLEMSNLVVETAENGKVAVDKFGASERYYYDAVLMDIRMPVMNGLDATKAIREMEREDAKNVPIIAMTANAFLDEKQEALQLGMTEYLTKPIVTEDFYKVLEKQLYRHRK